MVRAAFVGASAVALCAVAALTAPQSTASSRFQVEPLWPRPLPNHWLFGSITGVAVDGRDHIWVVHRGGDSLNARTEIGLATNPPTAESCCAPAPPVLEFDAAGVLVGHWGGPGEGYQWPRSPGGMAVDDKGNVWITAAGVTEAAAGRGGRGAAAAAPAAPLPQDGHVLKFARDGKFMLQIGKAGSLGDAASTTALNRPTAIAVDAGEVYVADAGSRRVVVFDAETGAHKRHWGAYGAPPDAADPGEYRAADPPAKQFRSLSCVEISRDGFVYVCDRKSNRLQVFKKDGTFVKESFISKTTLGEGSAWDVAFSADSRQRQLFVADGQDQRVFVLDRETLAIVSSFGGGGRWPGGFFGVGSVAVDSRGNVYTGENFEGKRLQKFVRR